MGDEHTYTQEERDRIITMIRAGLERGKRAAVTAKELGISERTFYRWLREKARGGARPAEAGAERAGRRCSSQEKVRIVSAIQRRVAAGEGVVAAARAEGISDACYYNWRREAKAHEAQAAPMRPVALVPISSAAVAIAPQATSPQAGELTLLAPGGYQIQGLNVDSAARLLRALSC